MEMKPVDVAVAVEEIYDELPLLLGAAQWEQIAPVVDEQLANLQSARDEDRQMQFAAELVGLLAPHEATRRRLHEALQRLDVRRATLLAVAGIAEKVGQDAAAASGLRRAAARPDRGESRVVMVSAGGTRAKSIKLGNLRLDYGAATELAAGVLALIHDVAGDKNPLLLAAGALLLIRGLEKMSTVALSEREATIFWGCAQASNEEKIAREEAILREANRARTAVGLEPLAAEEMKNVLFNLAQLRCIQRVSEREGAWQIRERYFVRTPAT
jgi:hypothetical protein